MNRKYIMDQVKYNRRDWSAKSWFLPQAKKNKIKNQDGLPLFDPSKNVTAHISGHASNG